MATLHPVMLNAPMSAFHPLRTLGPTLLWRAMTFRTRLVGLLISLAVFATCCVAMLQFGPQMDSEVLVYAFMALWGVSALVWPVFAVMVIRASLSSASTSMRKARQGRRGGYY
jgi:hypothetical protein